MPERNRNPMGTPADWILILPRLFDAPRPLVLAAWTKKEDLDGLLGKLKTKS